MSGSGLVTLGIPRSLNTILARKLTEVMTKPLAETEAQTLNIKAYPEIMKFQERADALAIGPGLSRNPETAKLIRKICASWKKQIVVDADGLNAFSGHLNLLRATILTPHIGEFARLINKPQEYVKKNKEELTKEFAKRYNVIVVLKGHRSIVASNKGNIYINKTGNPGMATAGAGDVLTGIIASFVGQARPNDRSARQTRLNDVVGQAEVGLVGRGITPFEAAKSGVYIHGLAGDLAARERGEASLLAGDILAKLPQAIKSVLKLRK